MIDLLVKEMGGVNAAEHITFKVLGVPGSTEERTMRMVLLASGTR